MKTKTELVKELKATTAMCAKLEVQLTEARKSHQRYTKEVVQDLLAALKQTRIALSKANTARVGAIYAAAMSASAYAIAKAEGRKNGGCRACDVGQGEP